MDEETACYVSFSVFPGIGPMRFSLLLEAFGSAEDAWHAPVQKLREIGLGERLTSQFDEFRKTFDRDSYLKELKDKGVMVLKKTDEKYPKLLKSISDAPFLLYIKGKPSSENASRGKPWDIGRAIAVVGTRKITHYGEDVTRKLVSELVSEGFTIVSGLAYGVDAVAHQTALDCGGKTIAVLGCGIDIIAPPSNASLYHAIENGGGAIISEMPLGLLPNKGLFPARNRIISGLSLGVVVTEGADDSGALITARNAGEQGREVFAIPGPITSPYSRGPAKLLKNGAKLVESVEDILEELNIPRNKRISESNLNKRIIEGETKEEQKILDILADRQAHIDEIVRGTGLTISAVASTLTVLEMKGIIKDIGEKVYRLT